MLIGFLNLYKNSKNSEVMREHLDEIVEDEEDAEPIFVLTEEWLEFFAKSEAKRRLGKHLCIFFSFCYNNDSLGYLVSSDVVLAWFDKHACLC